MTNAGCAGLLIAVLGTATTTLISQTVPARPPRDVRGSARVSGVVAGVDGVPLEGVTLSLMSSAWKRETSISDARGRFAFAELGADLYRLRAEKAGYLSTEYGALRPDGDGTAIALGEGQRAGDLAIVLVRTGVISGTVRDGMGQPVRGITVNVTPRDGNGVTGVGHSDERGVYRVDGLRPGEYKVLAMPASWRESVPVFHPGTPSPAQATTVRLDRGEEREDVDISLVSSPPAPLHGVVLDLSGLPAAGAQLFVVPPAWGGLVGNLGRTTGPDGEFVYETVFPGRYVLRAYLPQTPGASTSDPATLWAADTVDVPVEGVADLTLRLQAPLVLSGRVKFVGRLPAPDPSSVRLQLEQDGWTPTPVEVRPDGTFERSVLPGIYQFSAFVPDTASRWRLQSATRDGRDLLDTPLELSLAMGSLTGVELTLSDLHTKLSGVVATTAGVPVSACYVVAFPADRALWSAPFRRFAFRRPATNGRFVFEELPSGDYFLAIVRDLDPNNWRTSEVLEALVPRATRVSLRDGEQKSQDLRVNGR
jgi:hypothetical protein